MVARTEGYTYGAKVWDLSIVQGPFSVARFLCAPLRYDSQLLHRGVWFHLLRQHGATALGPLQLAAQDGHLRLQAMQLAGLGLLLRTLSAHTGRLGAQVVGGGGGAEERVPRQVQQLRAAAPHLGVGFQHGLQLRSLKLNMDFNTVLKIQQGKGFL
jgi:hypothetical protein